ncbi:MAG: hypothetical protein IJ775_01885 [Muribaculaceae bacterium]|nr:hypothetical protein [Muribaculaceae bacterium]
MTPNAAAQQPIPVETLVNMIAQLTHWNEDSLAGIGLAKLKSEIDDNFFDVADDGLEGEACDAVASYFVYGHNVKVAASEGWNVTLAADGPHAIAIEVTLMTDNDTKLYFKDKADHDAFMNTLRQSSDYERYEYNDNHDYNEYIGSCLIQSDEFIDGWYIIDFHAG